MENHCPDNFFALTLTLPTQRCVSIWFCPKLDFKVEISSIFVACLENLNFNYNLESRSGIQNPEKISLCRLLSAGTSTIGLSIVAARKFQPALESTWHRLWTHSWFLITLVGNSNDPPQKYCNLDVIKRLIIQSRLVKTGRNWSKPVKTGWNWSKLVKIVKTGWNL